MQVHRVILATAFSFPALLQSALAGQFGYQCTITDEYTIRADGEFAKSSPGLLIGKRFAIDRKTGTLVGPDKALWALGGSKTVVLASGNADNSFTATIVSPARADGVHATFIRIQEYADGPKKPFVVMSGGTVNSGFCD